MKLSQLKTIIKEAVKEAIQEEMKEILIEAVRTPKQVVQETVARKPLPEKDKKVLRENMMNVLNGMSRKGGAFNNQDSGNGTPGQSGGIVLNNSSAKIAFDAEL